MVLTNQMKYILNEGRLSKIKHSARRRQEEEEKLRQETGQTGSNLGLGLPTASVTTTTGTKGGTSIPPSSVLEPDKEGTFKWIVEEQSIENRRRRPCYNKTKEEEFDLYSNVEVGTKLRHLYFGGLKFGSQGIRPINFTHIVDLDTMDYQKIIIGRFLEDVLASYIFRWTILGLVILNALIIGLNTYEAYSEAWRKPFEIIDQIILSVFVFEILIKWMYDFRAFWVVSWNILDFVILAMIGFASLLPTYIQSRTALAIIRVVRALRSLRSVSNLTSLIVVSHTIIKSTIDMVNILFVLIIFMVVMAIGGVVLFDDASFQTTMFLDALDAWFVLFVCVTQDGWLEVLDSFRQIETSSFIVIVIYLITAVSIGAFVFANLIVAVVVANLESAIRALKIEKMKNENPLVYQDEFSPNEIEIVTTYSPFRITTTPLLLQRPMAVPKVSLSKRRLKAYLAAIVALEQNLLEFSIIENDFIQILSVILGILRQVEKYQHFDEDTEKRRKQAVKELKAYSMMTIPSETLERVQTHANLVELKGRSSYTSLV